MAIKHLFTSTKPAAADVTKVDGPRWNDPHTIEDGTITLTELVEIDSPRIIGRTSALTGAIEVLTAAEVKVMLAIAIGDVVGLSTALTSLADAITALELSLADIATSGSASDLIAGTVPAARMPAHTGDVTSLAGAVALTIAPAAVTYAKIQDVTATQRALGRNTAGAGDVEEVTAAQILDWVTTTPGVLARGAGGWGTAANVTVDAGDLQFADSTGAAPAAGLVKLFMTTVAARPMLAAIGPAGARVVLQPHIGQGKSFRWLIGVNNVVGNDGMAAPTAGAGTVVTGRTSDPSSAFTVARRVGLVSAAGAGSVGSLKNPITFISRSQGFHFTIRGGISDAVLITDARMFFGLAPFVTAPTNVDPSTLVNILGVGVDSGDTTLQLYASGAAAQARTQLVITSGPNVGGTMPANTINTDFYEFTMFVVPSGAAITYQVTRINTGDVAAGSISAAAALPALTTLLTPHIWRSNGATAAASGVDVFSMYGDTES